LPALVLGGVYLHGLVWRFRMGATFPPRLVLGCEIGADGSAGSDAIGHVRCIACFQRGRYRYGRIYPKMELRGNKWGAIRYRWSHAITAPYSHVAAAWTSDIYKIDFLAFKLLTFPLTTMSESKTV
jgi:hypothetical protein